MLLPFCTRPWRSETKRLYRLLGTTWRTLAVPTAPQSPDRYCSATWWERLESDKREAGSVQTASLHWHHCWSSGGGGEQQPNKERHITSHAPLHSNCTVFLIFFPPQQLAIVLQHTILPRVLASLRNTIKTGIAEQGMNTLWCLLRKLQELEQSYNRPAVMNPILAIKHLCDLLYRSN